MQEPQEQRTSLLFQMIDMRIPLWGVLGASIVVIWGLLSMYFNVINLVRAVEELQITVKSGNTSTYTLASEVALLKFRVGTTEEDLKRLNEMVRNQQLRR